MNDTEVRGQGDVADAVMPMDEAVRASMAYCHQVAKRRARNFYYGLKLTPEPKRSAVYAVYAFMRACDDMADGNGNGKGKGDGNGNGNAEAVAGRIETFRAQMQSVLDGPADGKLPEGKIWPAFRYVVKSYAIDPAHLHAMLDGQCLDLQKHRYASFEQLYDYCYKVASVVGLVCIAIWGHDGSRPVKKLAEHRGIALQLTNILRDVAEDAQRGRIYLPQEDLERFEYTVDDLLAGKVDERFERLMRFEVERAFSYYEMSVPLEPHLDPACRPTSWAMMRIYRGLLERIAGEPRRVFTERVRLGSPEKLGIALRAAWKRSWSTD